mmetsp:Transcript_71441/g.87644  ORF Transcript_71441/g.87644 Transcript_71441/m.87644 type:complete len:425 (+) Transcript_71441:60-1334(+)
MAAVVTFPGTVMMPWDVQMPAQQVAQQLPPQVLQQFPQQVLQLPQPPAPGVVAMQVPLECVAQFPMVGMEPGNFQQLLPPPAAVHVPHELQKDDAETTSAGTSAPDDWYDEAEERQVVLTDPTYSKGKMESKAFPLKTPVAPGRVNNEGMAWFTKQALEQLQQQLEGSDVPAALEVLTGHVWDLSRHPVGCRLVQSAIERSNPKQGAALASELRSHVHEAMTSPHANYVLQKIVTHLTWQNSKFVAEELRHMAAHFARHRFGCRIFCRLIEFHAEQEPTLMLVEEVLQEAEDLCCHPFGHHVAQSILEHGIEQHREFVCATIDRNPLGYARNQNASYLVERVLSGSTRYQESVLSELSYCLEDLALSRYGCYVARAVVEHPKTNRPLEVSKLTAIRQELNKTKHGQYLLADLGLSQKHSKKYAH